MIVVPTLVDPIISKEKLRREFELWQANSVRNERGWVLLRYDEEILSVEIAFMAKLSTSTGSGPLAAAVCAIRLTYENYDIWAPSLTFIDVFTRQPAMPHVAALVKGPDGFRNVLIGGHPATQLPFLCLPGIREYHTHPQHTGDDWLLHRASGEGNLSTICDRIWRFMVTNIVGLHVITQALPSWPFAGQLAIQIAQDVAIADPGGASIPNGAQSSKRTKAA